jgi:peptide/nickel transport system substrate-binding protein
MFKKIFNSSKIFIYNLFSFKRKKIEDNLDKNLVYSLSASNIPNKKQLKHIGRFLTKKEKIIIIILGFLLIANLIYLSFVLYNRYWQAFPKIGGTYTEGVLGLPRFINPLYSTDRDVDADLAYLIYSSLFTYNQQGELIGDLVINWEISEDSLEYTLDLQTGVKWHEGGELTADDVFFTFYLMKNPEFRSPWQRNLAGIELKVIDDHQIKVILQEPYAPLFELLTFGILPKFAWENTNPDFVLLADLNLKPIGSGPFKFKSLTKSNNGEIKSYRLTANLDYYGDKPYLEDIVFKFYFDFFQLIQALNNQAVDGIAYLPPELKSEIISKSSFNFNSLSLPQITALFFNQTKDVNLKSKEIRRALAISLNRDKLINEALFGLARRSDGPLPISNFAYNPNLKPLPYNLTEANELLAQVGWEKVYWSQLDNQEDDKLKKEILEVAEKQALDIEKSWLINEDRSKFFLINLKIPEGQRNLNLANLIKEAWEKIGIRTTIELLNSTQMNTDILKDKDFSVLLQKQIIGHDPDVSAFWHSSQRNNGLNIINYNNQVVDELLTEARQISSSQADRIKKYHSFQELLVDDLPAIFLFSPDYLYIQTKKLKGFETEFIIEPRHRFSSINSWHLKTKHKFIR